MTAERQLATEASLTAWPRADSAIDISPASTNQATLTLSSTGTFVRCDLAIAVITVLDRCRRHPTQSDRARNLDAQED